MNQKTIKYLGATVVGLILLLVIMRTSDDNNAIVSGGMLLPDFRAIANNVSEVRISRTSADESLRLERVDGNWVVTDRDNYAADVGKIRQLIIALADAKIVEEKTSNPDNYDRLGVKDPQDGGSGTEVVVVSGDATNSVILGEEAQGEFRYARVSGEQQSFLVDQSPDLPAEVGDWLLPDVLDLAATRIRSVTISHADGETIAIEKSERAQTDFDVLGVPEDRELSYATVANGIAGALADLTLDDVRAATDAPPSTTTVFDAWNALQITAEIVEDDDTSWITFAAAAVAVDDAAETGLTESAASSADDTLDDSAENASNEDQAQESKSAADEAAEINERLAGWQYKLADYQKNLLVRRWDDILKAEEDEES